ncbi:RdgB/HAM1 family non-canonical purine NTP pyrophosphatase [Gammaproteobacteria bacterium]|nr:RdgB/HAM1 family non-canonical purine NTP pyrophosphatase [Gammaproteobacteria bacterium]
MKIAIATKNLGKLKEFQQLTKNTNFELIPIPERISELPPETGKTFYENALIKAKFISNALEIPAIGDDSGLEVDALNGRPGIYSARYSESGEDKDNCLKLLKNMTGLKTEFRAARFKCCLVGFFEGKIIKSFGALEGKISEGFKGDKGFGYDPIFITQSGMHLAELEKEEKNAISHRSLAFRELLKDLSKLTN